MNQTVENKTTLILFGTQKQTSNTLKLPAQATSCYYHTHFFQRFIHGMKPKSCFLYSSSELLSENNTTAPSGPIRTAVQTLHQLYIRYNAQSPLVFCYAFKSAVILLQAAAHPLHEENKA